jgi:acetyl-CoA acyltransferase 2
MALTAENLADIHGITREQADLYALQSQHRWQRALDNGAFKDEIAPITFKGKKGPEIFSVDEHPRGNATIQDLSKLPAVFKKGGTVTAGNASGICDGAGAIILADEETVKANNLTPLARFVSYQVSGVDPKVMGRGPVPAIQNLLKKNKLTVNDIDLFDINEAFASQFLACQIELGLNPEKSNVNGGAIGLGHPLAASGARITSNLVYELARRKGKYAIGGACIGGGQGIAVLLQSV